MRIFFLYIVLYIYCVFWFFFNIIYMMVCVYVGKILYSWEKIICMWSVFSFPYIL